MSSHAKQTYKSYLTSFAKQQTQSKRQSTGAAGPCISLVTGEILNPNRRRHAAVPDMAARYSAYMKSKAWQSLRARYLASDCPKDCAVCGMTWRDGFHFHHLTYDRFGCELLTDIVPCCPYHHKRIHRLQKEFPYLNVSQVTEIARNDYRHSQSE